MSTWKKYQSVGISSIDVISILCVVNLYIGSAMVQNYRNSIPSVNESLLIRQKVNTNEAENGQYIRNAGQDRSEYDLKMVQSSGSPDKSA